MRLNKLLTKTTVI